MLAEIPFSILLGFAFVFGAIWGSFLNVCIYRLPAEQSIIFPSSRCQKCRTRIVLQDNIPILGYFLLRGRCRFCGTPFSMRYALIELLTGIVSFLLFWHYQWHWQYWFIFAFVCSMIVVTFVDIDHRIIPDEISIGGAVIGVLLSLLMPLFIPSWFVTPKESILGLLFGGGLLLMVSIGYKTLTGTDGIGLGDVKLLAMIGSWFGWPVVLATIFLSSCLGSVYGVTLMIISGRSSKYPIPFGPFIVVGALVSLFFGKQWLNLLFGTPF